MIELLGGLLQSRIVQTVAFGAAMLGALAGMLGAFAVLRRQSLLGDTLSHAALPGVCLGFLLAGSRDLAAILAGALASGTLAALCVMLIVRRTRLKTDAALGVVLGVFFAAGVVLLTLAQARGGAAQAGLATFLFGQAAAILRSDLWIIGGALALTAILLAALWKEFKLVTFDPEFARMQGLPVLALEAGLTVMVALAIVVGLQLVGVVLMVALLIAPAVAARQWTDSLGRMVVLSAGFGAAAGLGGAMASATARGLATGPVVVLLATALVIVSLALAPGRGLIWQALEARRAARRLQSDRVLMTLCALGAAHEDPAFRAGTGMIDLAHGARSRRVLDRLETEGMVRKVSKPPDPAPHWELTDRGRTEASRLQTRRAAGVGAADEGGRQ